MRRIEIVGAEPSEPKVNLTKRVMSLIYCELRKLGPLGPLGSRCTIKRLGALALSIQCNSTILIYIINIYIITICIRTNATSYISFFYPLSVFQCEPSEPFEPNDCNILILNQLTQLLRFTLGSLGSPLLKSISVTFSRVDGIGRARLSDKQQQVKSEITQSGGIWIVARSFTQFQESLNLTKVK